MAGKARANSMKLGGSQVRAGRLRASWRSRILLVCCLAAIAAILLGLVSFFVSYPFLREYTGQSQSSAEQASPAVTPAQGNRVAVCMVGAARDFEITGPSILRRLLPAYGDADVFLHSPLDEGAYKLWILKEAANLRAVRIFGNSWVDESKFRTDVLKDATSPQGLQGMYQYFRLIEGCIPLIRSVEQQHNFTYRWVLRIRVDSFWSGPPPPLDSLDPRAYSIPYGTDCGGLNDRGGIGTWRTSEGALRRLTVLQRLPKKTRGLNSHRALRSQLQHFRIPVARANFSMCIVTRRVYFKNEMPIFPMPSPAVGMFENMPLNGAKCQPCEPKFTGRKGVAKYMSYIREAHVFPGSRPSVGDGVALCDTTKGWQDGWEELFDRQMGSPLADERRRVVGVSWEECVRHFEEMKSAASLWDSPPPAAICLRWKLGKTKRLGTDGHSFDTFLQPLNNNSLVISTSSARSNREWEAALQQRLPGLPLEFCKAAHLPVGDISVLKLSLEGGDLDAVQKWIELQRIPSTCQLIISFPHGKPSHTQLRRRMLRGIRNMGFVLNSCIKERSARFNRCLLFSLEHCTKLLR